MSLPWMRCFHPITRNGLVNTSRHPATLLYVQRLKFVQSFASVSTSIDLPRDVLDRLPDAFKTSDKLSSVLNTCRSVYRDHGVTCPDSDILYHLVTNPHAGFPPQVHPHLLTGHKARELADWVAQDLSSRELQIQESIEKGPDALLSLAISVSPLVLDDVVRFHDIVNNIIIPVSESLDPAKNPASEWGRWGSKQLELLNNEYKTPHRDPGYLEGRSISQDIVRAMANHWIYCELFHHTIYNTFMRPSPLPPQLSWTTRLKWLANCVPDCNDQSVSVSNPSAGDQSDLHELYYTFYWDDYLAPVYKAGRFHCRDFLVYMDSAGLDSFRACLLKQEWSPTGISKVIFDAMNERPGNEPWEWPDDDYEDDDGDYDDSDASSSKTVGSDDGEISTQEGDDPKLNEDSNKDKDEHDHRDSERKFRWEWRIDDFGLEWNEDDIEGWDASMMEDIDYLWHYEEYTNDAPDVE